MLAELSDEELKSLLSRGEIRASFFGLGRVGIPSMLAWANAGARCIGVDVKKDIVMKINNGESPINEPLVQDWLSKFVRDGRVRATTDGASASRETEVKVITVPVTLLNGKPDLSALEKAALSIAAGLKRGDLVILESSVPPGTTRGFLKRILEEKTGMKAEDDFLLAYSPERIAEGRAIKDIVENYPKIVGGIGPKSLRVASALYEMIAKKGVKRMSNEMAAEFEKLAEGVYRDVNIALANELAELCRELGLDFEEIREAANSQPYSHLHKPGTGVGGLCIPIYPVFLMEKANSLGIKLSLVETARKINRDMPGKISFLVKKVAEIMELSYPNIGILGLAFRGDLDDSRLSPTYDLVLELMRLGYRSIIVHDPFIKEDEVLKELGVKLTSNLEEVLTWADIIVISTDHSLYKEIDFSKLCARRRVGLVDGRDVVENRAGCVYVGVGRPFSYK
ncbi:nucleotide sugar dehydrogenase [Candidatus Methanodesulfokora washburnensis]|uniref:UDP-N-acetyl-D-mannosamine dehydrogenase n=1 Tax=Candidatus Methanodesulfokora washburnensis TaxID=2478471 RepID=A0A3R9PGX9_9CREN|nr:nucleotide sugar dehydrogenase [Candidatus Methanodesulfokores washburnensis]RSN76152.1 nucleotide sugar dehydrogenase [Candidatus Methanodesulfokores washburnensis]